MSIKNGARFVSHKMRRQSLNRASRAIKRAPNQYLISQANFLPQNCGVARVLQQLNAKMADHHQSNVSEDLIWEICRTLQIIEKLRRRVDCSCEARFEQLILGEAQEWRRISILERPSQLNEQTFEEGQLERSFRCSAIAYSAPSMLVSSIIRYD